VDATDRRAATQDAACLLAATARALSLRMICGAAPALAQCHGRAGLPRCRGATEVAR